MILYFCGMKSQFLIAAPTSGSGKTTVARGLMALLTEKGYNFPKLDQLLGCKN